VDDETPADPQQVVDEDACKPALADEVRMREIEARADRGESHPVLVLIEGKLGDAGAMQVANASLWRPRQSPLTTEPEREQRVFSRPNVLSKASGRQEGFTRDQQIAACRVSRTSLSAGQPFVEVEQVGSDRDGMSRAGVQDRPRHHRRSGFGVPLELVEPARRGNAIGIEKRDQPSPGGSCADVSGAPLGCALRLDDEPHPWPSRAHRFRPAIARALHDEHFPVWGVDLGRERLEDARQSIPSAESRNHDGDFNRREFGSVRGGPLGPRGALGRFGTTPSHRTMSSLQPRAQKTSELLPPSPRLPGRVQALAFRYAHAWFLDACRRRYGALVTFRSLFDAPCVIVFDPELVKQVLRESRHTLRVGDSPLRQVLGERPFVELDGQEHLRSRRRLSPSFHGEALESYRRLINEATDRAIASWAVEEPLLLLPSFQRLTLEVITGVVLGPLPDERRDQLGERFEALVRSMSGPLPRLSRAARAVTDRRLLDELLLDEITRHRAAPGGHGHVVSMLLDTRNEDGAALADQEIADQIVMLLIAGTETTSAGLAWAFELLLSHPLVLQHLRVQLARGDEDYLAALVKETLRLRPTLANVTRCVGSEPYALGGYLIPPGTQIRVSLATVHRQAEYFPDPLAFCPERFLGSAPAADSVWLPFGAGVHRCLGASFATFQMQVVIRRVLESVRLRRTRRSAARTAIPWFAQVPAEGGPVLAEPLKC
jgi:cytochrome P450